jgi:hypothetical protein
MIAEEVYLNNLNQFTSDGLPGKKFPDPFGDINPSFLGERIIIEGLYWPFLFLGLGLDSSTANGLLIFVCRDSLNVIIWSLSISGVTVEYRSQAILTLAQLVKLIKALGCSSVLSKTCFDYLSKVSPDTDPHWFKAKINALCLELQEKLANQIKTAFELEQNSNLNSILCVDRFSGWKPSSWIFSVLDNLMLDKDTFNIINEFHKCLTNRIKANSELLFPQIADFCLTREFIFLISGKHIAVDPFTDDMVISDRYASSAIPSTSCSAKRFILFESKVGIRFIEVRGPGWLDVTTHIILESGLCFPVISGPQWSANFAESDLQNINRLFHGDETHGKDNEIYYTVDCGDGRNLGHVLWNEASSYVEFASICSEINWFPENIIIVFAQSIKNNFSSVPVRDFFNAFVIDSLNALCEESQGKARAIYQKFIDKITICRKNNGINIDSNAALFSFRYARVSQSLVASILRQFPYVSANQDEKSRILVNLRSHNKSHINIVECIEFAIKNFTKADPDWGKKYSFHLEFSADSKNIADEIKAVCDRFLVDCVHHLDCDLKELIAVTSSANLCIAPVGSGAVISCWVCKVPTLVHGDKSHMDQISWWPYIGGINPKIIVPIRRESISDVSMNFYSDYSIDVEEYFAGIRHVLESPPGFYDIS